MHHPDADADRGHGRRLGRALVSFPPSSQVPSGAQFGQPRVFVRKYDKLLPNVGVSYQVAPGSTVYASFAQTLSAPRTDDLYDQKLTMPKAETADVYDLGYRYSSPLIVASASVFYDSFHNRIERAFDEAANIFFSINVGDVILKGANAEIGIKPARYFSAYASLSYVDSELQDDIPTAWSPACRSSWRPRGGSSTRRRRSRARSGSASIPPRRCTWASRPRRSASAGPT